MIKNGHFCAICCRPEVDCEVISGQNVKTIVGYVVVHFEAASSNSFRDIKKHHFVTAEAEIDDSIKRKHAFRLKIVLGMAAPGPGPSRW